VNEIDKMLKNKKLEIDELYAPEELETRLRNALERKHSPQKARSRWRVKAAAIFIAIVFLGYNIDTLAFYGKKLIGYDQVMSGTIKNLNESGKGQVIDKTYTFKNGASITLDGVMLDENQLLAFYSIKDAGGNIDKIDIDPIRGIKGIVGQHYMKGATGSMNDSKTEIKWIAEFETPYFFERKLKFNFALMDGNKTENGEIVFTLDRNKAMGHTLKKSLNKTVKLDQNKIIFESITASPTTTYVKGTIQNILELAKDQISGERFRPESLEVKLIANGKEVQEQGGGMSTNMNGITFDKKYDALPKDIKTLQLQLVSFTADHDVNNQVEIEKGQPDKTFEILGQSIEINKVDEINEETFITITTEESLVLSRVHLIADGKNIELQDTISDKHDKKTNGTITHTRTLRFKGIGESLQLDIKRIKYNKIYNEVVEIPID
jgi:hypothetical protein